MDSSFLAANGFFFSPEFSRNFEARKRFLGYLDAVLPEISITRAEESAEPKTAKCQHAESIPCSTNFYTQNFSFVNNLKHTSVHAFIDHGAASAEDYKGNDAST